MALTPGTLVGSYAIQTLLGAGGMGEVYLAEDTRLSRRVALKVLPASLAMDEGARKRLLREARAVAALNHPNICTIYEVGEADGHSFIAMQYVEGETLKARLSRGPMDLHLVLLIGKQVTDALVESHHRGIIHRDIKPQNIIVSDTNQTKVLDFGIATATADNSGNTMSVLTAPGLVAGTIAYMSPEQLRGEAVDERSDVFSVGIVLYEAIARIHPFDGPSSAERTSAILTRDPSISDIGAPPELRRILRKALEKDRNRRYQTMRDLAIDLENLTIDMRGTAPEVAKTARARRWGAWAAGMAVLAGTAGAAWWYRGPAAPVPVSVYQQITDFSDSATAPSLSSDGSMVTFIRGGTSFLTRTGQIYVKRLPNGDAIRLTDDPRPKLAPVFTPDGTRVAFTLRETGTAEGWHTWTVPISGGLPTRLLPNATGLSWIDNRRILFSEILTGSTLHMALVTSTQDRANSRTVYVPAHERGMAHYSNVSPDGRSVLIVEMTGTGAWGPCRVVPFDGSSRGRQAGPDGECRSAAWSPDGRWMYFSAVVDGVSHLWRERFPNGKPEALTSGSATDEEGVAIAPDGQSLITSVGRRQSAVWLHDANGERMLSGEGFAFNPHLSADGRRVYYLRRQSDRGTGELILLEIASGRTERLLPDHSVLAYDISRDERHVAFTITDDGGERQVWVASLDRSSAPRLLAKAADDARFTDGERVVFRSLEGHENFVNRIGTDGRMRERVLPTPIVELSGASPDGRWVLARVPLTDEDPSLVTVAAPIAGGTPRLICDFSCSIRWSVDGRQIYIWSGVGTGGRRPLLIVPVPPGQVFPEFPVDSSPARATWAKLPGAQAVEREDFEPGADVSTYVFTKSDERRNLFRVPLVD